MILNYSTMLRSIFVPPLFVVSAEENILNCPFWIIPPPGQGTWRRDAKRGVVSRMSCCLYVRFWLLNLCSMITYFFYLFRSRSLLGERTLLRLQPLLFIHSQNHLPLPQVSYPHPNRNLQPTPSLALMDRVPPQRRHPMGVHRHIRGWGFQ